MGKHGVMSKEEFALLPPCSFTGCRARYDESLRADPENTGWRWLPGDDSEPDELAPHAHSVDFESAYPLRPFTVTVTDETGAVRFVQTEDAHSATGAMQQITERKTNGGW
jgi:hypothetical protein